MKFFLTFFVFCLIHGTSNAKNTETYGDPADHYFINKLNVFAQPNYDGHVRRNVTFPKVLRD